MIVKYKAVFSRVLQLQDDLKKIDAEIYCLLNSDVEVTENWLKPVLDLFQKDLKIAAVQPKILD